MKTKAQWRDHCRLWARGFRKRHVEEIGNHVDANEFMEPAFRVRTHTFHHAKTEASVLRIQEEGFLIPLGSGGLLGPGVYCTPTFKKAMDYLKGPCEGVILELKIDLGNCNQLVENDPMMKTWQHDYDSVWAPFSVANPADKEKQENCIKDPQRIKVVSAIVGNTTEAEPILQKERTLVKENNKMTNMQRWSKCRAWDAGAHMTRGQGLNSKFSVMVRHEGGLGP